MIPEITLCPLHVETLRLGAQAARALGIPSAHAAARSQHDLWTAALLVHEVESNPFWKAGQTRPARAVQTALAASRRLTDRAFAELGAAHAA